MEEQAGVPIEGQDEVGPRVEYEFALMVCLYGGSSIISLNDNFNSKGVC